VAARVRRSVAVATLALLTATALSGCTLRGVNVAGGAFADSLPMPGTYGEEWFYEVDGEARNDPAGMEHLAAEGVEAIRVDFRWERIQHVLYGPLDAAEVARLRATLDAAHGAGMGVVLDMGNFGHRKPLGAPGDGQSGPTIGDPGLPVSSFTDAWARIAAEFGRHPAIVGWEIMNEPAAMTGGADRWRQVSQAAVTAIRFVGSSHLIYVDGYNWAQVQGWTARHAQPWIEDPLGDDGRIRYTGHHYWDGGGYGGDGTYGTEDVTAETRTRVLGHIDQFIAWCRTHGVRCAITEVGWPDNVHGDAWAALAEEWLDRADAARLDVFAFAAGTPWPLTFETGFFLARPNSWHNGDVINTTTRQGELLKRHLAAGD
jgi:endoglucanase